MLQQILFTQPIRVNFISKLHLPYSHTTVMPETRKFIAQTFCHFAISGTKSSGKIIGVNDRKNVAVCGIKGRGASHIGGQTKCGHFT